MLVYLAELSHTGHGRSPNVVPLAAGYIAAAAKDRFPGLEIKIFRDPNEYLEAVKTRPPDVAGFSLHVWSERLSDFCAARTKERSPRTVIAVGGPSIDDVDDELLDFLKRHPQFDVCVPSEGEVSFVRLLEHLDWNGELMPGQVIEGCARLSSDGSLLRGPYPKPDMDHIPSPYLLGYMDRFLEEGYEPIIQSMRGCPYSCAFCVSGTPLWSKMRSFSLDRVFAELDYIRARTKTDILILTDENLGILRERDIEMAERLMKSSREHNYPARLYFYTAKIVNEYVLKVIETLSLIGEFGMSFQTLDEDIRRGIKRTNVAYDKFLEYVGWAKKKNITTSTELIFGFPGDTTEVYINGLEKLMLSGVDRIYSYNLRLFSGIDLATKPNREKHGYKTMHRLAERTYGRYDGVVVAETEEVVVGGRTFSMDDYLKVRKFGLFLELASGRGYLSELIHLLVRSGLPGERLVRFLTENDFADSPHLRAIVRDYYGRIESELFPSWEKCEDSIRSLLEAGKPVPEVKLNLIFTGKIMLSRPARAELFGLLKTFIRNQAESSEKAAFFEDYIDNVLANRIITFSPEEPRVLRGHSRIRLGGVDGETRPADLWLPKAEEWAFELPVISAGLIEKRPLVDPGDESVIQDIYMTLARNGLMRSYKPMAANG